MAPRAGLARLWAPWRMPFVKTADEPKGCLFCRVARAHDDRANFVLHRDGRILVMLNRYPYNTGHLMVAPLRHAANLAALEPEERAAVTDALIRAEAALAAEYHPHALNLGANLGKVAGAGFPGHLHFHIVPRWNGDTNFMPVVAETKVLPESLGRTWSRLRRAMSGLGSRSVARGNGTGGGAKRSGAARRGVGRTVKRGTSARRG